MSITARADGPPDVYFAPEYGRAASIADQGEWLHVEAHDGAWRMPLIVRTLADGGRDAITPTFSGVYASSAMTSEQVQDAWATTIEDLRRRGVISVVVRGSPHVRQATRLGGLRPISTGRPTIVLDLSDEASSWDGLRSSCRSRIRKAQKNGYTGDVRPVDRADLEPGGDFRRLYDLTMERIGADPLYLFDDSYYAALLDGLGPNLLLAEARDQDGAVASACLLMRHDQLLHYHLAGSRPDDARMGSNNLMMWTAIQFAVEQGLDQFHIGAGAAGRDSVFRFKSTFGGREATYDVSGLVVDDASYQEQVRSRAQECGVTVDALLASGFFPAYRAGSPVGSA
ncbi:MAG: GNAT family N-acetyltransferase [Aeromicrobium sp.]